MDDDNIFPVVTEANVLDIARALHADALRHAEVLGQVMAFFERSGLMQQSTMPSPMPPEAERGFPPVWLPNRSARAIENVDHRNVHHVGWLQTTSQDTVTRLRATWLAKFYVNHLKKYPFVRRAANWVWRNTYPIYVNNIATRFRNKNANRWRRLVKLSVFTETSEVERVQMLDAATVELPVPRVFPACDQNYLAAPRGSYEFPRVCVATVSGGTIYGGSNLVLAKDVVICHDLYDFRRDYTGEELHGRALIDPKNDRIRWLLHDAAPGHLHAAATFVDACAPNYAHWLTEVLPRIAVFCAADRFKKIPIVVNDGLHRNIMESVFLIAGKQRQIVTLPTGRALRIDQLYVTSVAGYVPFEPRRKVQSEGHHGLFSPDAFRAVRIALSEWLENSADEELPRKVYIRRNSGARNIINSAEIEELLFGYGFAIVEPEKLSFVDQLRVFSHAQTIVGPVGAALANAMFIKRGARIGIMVSKHKEMLYGYWPNIAGLQGADVSYIFGEVTENEERGVHGDFYIPISAIKEFIEATEDESQSDQSIRSENY